MDLLGIGNILGQAVGTAGSLYMDEKNRQWNSEEAQKNRDFQTAEREATQDFNIDMWNMNNEYNSLSSQMARAKQAGVNPSALLGSSGGSGSIANAVSSSPMSGSQASFNSSLSSTFANNMASLAQSIANTSLTEKQAENQGQQNDFFSLTKEKQIELMDKNIQSIDASIQRDLADAGEKWATTANIRESFKWISRLNDAELQARMQSLNNMRTDNLKTLQEYENLVKEGKWIDARNQATIENIESSTAENYADAALAGQQTHNAVIYGEIQELQNQFSKETGIPVGTPEFHAQWALYVRGKLPQYVDDVIAPTTQARWRPSDRYMPNGNYHVGSWNGRKGQFNPSIYNDGYQDEEIRLREESMQIEENRALGSILEGVGQIVPF